MQHVQISKKSHKAYYKARKNTVWEDKAGNRSRLTAEISELSDQELKITVINMLMASPVAHRVKCRRHRRLGSIHGSGKCPGERNGNPLQYSCLENSMDRGAWQATVHRVAKSRTRLSDFTSLHFTSMLIVHTLNLLRTCQSRTHLQDRSRG